MSMTIVNTVQKPQTLKNPANIDFTVKPAKQRTKGQTFSKLQVIDFQ